MTLSSDVRDTHDDAAPGRPTPVPDPAAAPRRRQTDSRPVEFWPTSSIRAALETDDLNVWQRIVVAVKRDPYGRTARQVEEVLHSAPPQGVSKALAEVLLRARANLEANECAEVGRHVRLLLERSGLGQQEFASRIGLPNEEFGSYLEGRDCPAASLMIRMRRLSDRFSKIHDERTGRTG
ncbi:MULTISPECIES: XRE family transcriptional regulator [unclassified Mycolicibacterium]|uniref:XRE family transcriptional regulator n=1 Tax=unclassified Mycolicibacterium TaxID=2636767 RepID=UPI001F4BD89D|nr:XRE family transcriptional regulator [Mycolicibacterium sp. YH-1]UNB52325.1 XRE family transcriptional regulator [Mycolicibacterium sp. YH-1]